MNSQEPKTKRQYQRELQLRLVRAGDFPSCLNCVNFNSVAEVCARFNDQRPPAEYIVVGCDFHEPDIPF